MSTQAVPIKVSDEEFVLSKAKVDEIEAKYGKGYMDRFLAPGAKSKHPNYQNTGDVHKHAPNKYKEQEWDKNVDPGSLDYNDPGFAKHMKMNQWMGHLANAGMFTANMMTRFPDPPREQVHRPGQFDKFINTDYTRSLLDRATKTGEQGIRTTGGNTAAHRVSLYDTLMDKYMELGQARQNYAAQVGQQNRQLNNQYGAQLAKTNFGNNLRQWQHDMNKKGFRLGAGQSFTNRFLDQNETNFQNKLDYTNKRNTWNALRGTEARSERKVEDPSIDHVDPITYQDPFARRKWDPFGVIKDYGIGR